MDNVLDDPIFDECKKCSAWSGTDCTRLPYSEGCLRDGEDKMVGQDTTQEQGAGQVEREMTFTERCDEMRQAIGINADMVKRLKASSVFKSEQSYPGQHGEMIANIMLAYRHLEDARMRVGKILQAAGDGVSILDK